MDFDEAVDRLRAALQGPLPGERAQARLAPQPRRDWPRGFDTARIRRAAGLLLMFPVARRSHLVLTVRADALRHGGQISLPGGVVEPGETIEQAALREAQEEVGLAVDQVELLGSLTPIDIPVSGFRLHPVVAATHERPALTPADSEVARILELSVAELLDPVHVTHRSLERDGQILDVPVLRAGGAEIWGATAMVLAEFLTALGWEGPIPGRPV
jgi:8-oxo-dGTP pyrophosphatase MutT (NUDIX family)